ncbi:MAG: hypothetical protein KIS85_06310 [Anaerolineales bacterium]|nr:hypothetical protein [Anaerolineales bacterium]
MADETIHPSEVAAAIAAKEPPSGLTIYGPAELVAAPALAQLPLMQPAPGFLGGIRSQRDSFGAGLGGQETVDYTLNWRVLFAEVGAGLGLADHYDGMVQLVAALFRFFREHHVIPFEGGVAVDVVLRTVGAFGVVPAPNDVQFFGFDVGSEVREILN